MLFERFPPHMVTLRVPPHGVLQSPKSPYLGDFKLIKHEGQIGSWRWWAARQCQDDYLCWEGCERTAAAIRIAFSIWALKVSTVSRLELVIVPILSRRNACRLSLCCWLLLQM